MSINAKQAKIIKLKTKGLKQSKIGQEVYPNATQQSANTMVSRELKKVNVQEALQQALAKHNITVDTAVEPIANALTAKKQNQFTGEITDDYTTQLNASKMALNLLGVQSTTAPTQVNNDDILNAIKTKDTLKITQAVFSDEG